MNVAIVYETSFGNTRKIAEAVADGILASNSANHVVVLKVAEATAERIDHAELLIVGAPTHYRSMPRGSLRRRSPATRGDLSIAVKEDPVSVAPRVREWLARLPPVVGERGAAAFDTRLAFPLAGGAARPIGRALRRLGYTVVSAPQGFIVDGARGPLRAGEPDRAKVWGAGIVRWSIRSGAPDPRDNDR